MNHPASANGFANDHAEAQQRNDCKTINLLQAQIAQLLQMQTQALPPVTSTNCIQTISTRLPTFNGKNDAEIWIMKVENIFESYCYPRSGWTQQITKFMVDKAKLWWFKFMKEHKSKHLSWDYFKSKLLEQYNYVYKQLEAQQAINKLKFQHADDYINSSCPPTTSPGGKVRNS